MKPTWGFALTSHKRVTAELIQDAVNPESPRDRCSSFEKRSALAIDPKLRFKKHDISGISTLLAAGASGGHD